MVMRSFELTQTHRSVTHTIDVEGYPDFDYQGYAKSVYRCRPMTVVLEWSQQDQKPWTLRPVLRIARVRKGGTVSEDNSQRKDIPLVMPGEKVWSHEIIAPDWVLPIIERFGHDYVPDQEISG